MSMEKNILINLGYVYRITDNGTRVAIIRDERIPKSCLDSTITLLDFDDIAKNLYVKNIMLLDADKNWYFWNEKLGAKELRVKNDIGILINAPTLDIAWSIVKNKYFSKGAL